MVGNICIYYYRCPICSWTNEWWQRVLFTMCLTILHFVLQTSFYYYSKGLGCGSLFTFHFYLSDATKYLYIAICGTDIYLHKFCCRPSNVLPNGRPCGRGHSWMFFLENTFPMNWMCVLELRAFASVKYTSSWGRGKKTWLSKRIGNDGRQKRSKIKFVFCWQKSAVCFESLAIIKGVSHLYWKLWVIHNSPLDANRILVCYREVQSADIFGQEWNLRYLRIENYPLSTRLVYFDPYEIGWNNEIL